MAIGNDIEHWNPVDLDESLERKFKITFRKFIERRKRNKKEEK